MNTPVATPIFTKKVAYIIGEDDMALPIYYDRGRQRIWLFLEKGWTTKGPLFTTEKEAAGFIQDTWGRNWGLTWV